MVHNQTRNKPERYGYSFAMDFRLLDNGVVTQDAWNRELNHRQKEGFLYLGNQIMQRLTTNLDKPILVTLHKDVRITDMEETRYYLDFGEVVEHTRSYHYYSHQPDTNWQPQERNREIFLRLYMKKFKKIIQKKWKELKSNA
jgi:hypothetical protein